MKNKLTFYTQSPQLGYRCRGHFGLAHLVQRCRVFLSDLEGQSEHRTRGDLLSANDVPGDPAAWPSEGRQHTVVIIVCSWRDRTGDARRDWAHGVMSVLPIFIMKDLLLGMLMPVLALFSQLIMKALMHAVFRMPYQRQRGHLLVFLEQELVAHIWSNVSTPPFVAL
ncbi:hypothetical protein Pcinc_005533 [Petrolisthes cinctipes]|uniref:Uncharacterized protein n=1 Tax=Petrolisthes cinctipes TaxID=88211 RepID=A0AAE1L2K6_PETCI|nr:hypothetical protein Pcinc_005533 [Petrolisthes cinctipes]